MPITINDPLETLSPEQRATLEAKSAAYPFDIHVMVATNLASKPLFESQVAGMVTGPKTLAIGIDPAHHFTFVRGSADLGLPNGPEVASAGNAYFKRGDLVTGIDSIAARSNDLRISARLVTSQTGTPIVVHNHTTSAGVWWMLGGLAAVVIAVTAYVIVRNRRRENRARELELELENERLELQTRNVEEQSWHDRMKDKADNGYDVRAAKRIASVPPSRAPYIAPGASYTPYPSAPPAPAPIIVNNQPNNSGLDMLIGYELGRSESPRVVEREVVVERDSGGSRWDSPSESSSSSSWDSSSDSSSSSDYGGGSDSGSSGGGGDW